MTARNATLNSRGTSWHTSLGLLAGLSLGGCFADDPSAPEDTDAMAASSEDGLDPAADSESGDPPDPTGTPDPTGDPPDPTGEPDGEFEFDLSPPEDYVQVDRMGMPAVNTAVITNKDKYNQASPTDDLDGDFVNQIVANLTGLHAALDDDLLAAGLVPCEIETCVAQAAPLVVPDTLTIDLGADAGFPNGRMPADTVIDITLAVILLDLDATGQHPLSLVGLNPTANDVALSDTFPYFAAPHL